MSSFQYVFPIYRSFGGERFYSWAHNDYLQLAIELGIPGLALSVLLILAIWRGASQRRNRLSQHPSHQYLHAGYCAAAVAIALHSFVDFGLHLPANAALLTVILGVILGASPAGESRQRSGPKRKSRRLRRSPPPQ